jgi:hypothetical protein
MCWVKWAVSGKMYYYEVGYYSMEDSGVQMLMHKRSFRKHQFNAMIFESSLEAARRYYADKLQEGEERLKRGNVMHPLRLTKDFIDIRLDELYSPIADIMCEKYGFEKPKVKAKFWGFGWSDLRKTNDWKENRSRLQRKISKAIVAELGECKDSWEAYKEEKATSE